MMAFDGTILGFGALFGALAGGAFFAGLALGMRLALRALRPMPVLLVSAALRIAALLGLSWWIAGHGPWALAGFALAFLVVRFCILAVARPPAPKGAASWN